MKILRVLYVVLVVASLGAAFAFYYRYQLKDEELAQYRELARLSNEVLQKVNAKLTQTREELEKSLQEVARLNKVIEVLEKDSLSFKSELEGLKKERDQLQERVALLLNDKSILEEKFHSLEELHRAIRIAKIELYRKRKAETIQRRLAKIEMLKAMDAIALEQGNRGYFVRESQTTFRPTRIRVELAPISKKPSK